MEPNITTTKQAFLSTQLKLLNTSLVTPNNNPLSKQATDSLLEKVNKRIAQQNRLAFPVESQRHVVEQIDSLYWRDVLSSGLPVRKAETVVKKDADLLSSLPETWEEAVLEDDGEESPETPEYQELRETLLEQQRRKEMLLQKLAGYKRLLDMLKPFEDARENLQPNIVTRDNKELEEQLTRLRVLLARVGSAVQSREQGSRALDDEVDSQRARKIRKIEAVLELG